MPLSYVNHLRIEGFGCFTDTTLSLTPIHAVIGASDTGKTTVLRALRALSKYAQLRNPHAGIADFDLYSHQTSQLEVRVTGVGHAILARSRGAWSEHHVDDEARDALGGHHMLRLQPASLREPTALIAEGSPLRFLDEHGLGLPSVYDAILSRDVAKYMELSSRLAKMFPGIKNVSLLNTNQQTKSLGVTLSDGFFVSSAAVSDGLLRWLAFAALPHLARMALVLVEEPENGLHPAATRDVMTLLRELSQKTQVVIATHSPAVAQELQPEEVTVLRRDDRGAVSAIPLADTVLEPPAAVRALK